MDDTDLYIGLAEMLYATAFFASERPRCIYRLPRFSPARHNAELTSRDVGIQLSRAGIRLAFVLNQALVAAAN
jgi:hypothetical protein